MVFCLDKVSLALRSVGMFVGQKIYCVSPMCGFADGFLGIVASLILSKGSHMVNARFDGSKITCPHPVSPGFYDRA